MALIGDFFTSIDTVFTTFFSTGAARVGGAARPVFNTMVSLYVVLWGLALWRGLIQEPLSDGVVRILKIILIGTFALNAAVYAPRIATTIFRTPDRLATVLIPTATTTSTGNALDDALIKGLDVGVRYTAAMSITAPIEALALFAQALVVWAATLILVIYACALILLSKISLSVVLALGPLFIALLLFEPTRSFFTGWLAQALNSLFTYVIAVAFVALGMAFFTAGANSSLAILAVGGVPAFSSLVPTVLVGGAVFIGLMQSGAIASALAGGVQIGTMGAVGWTFSKAAGAAASPWRAAQAVRGMNQRRLANDYYRKQMGMKPTLTTRMMNRVMRGDNKIEKN